MSTTTTILRPVDPVDAVPPVPTLVDDGWHRVANSPTRELLTAVTAVGDIADARFDALVADAYPIRSAWARTFEQLT